jgi:cell wall-associated NlpC family hydrolase
MPPLVSRQRTLRASIVAACLLAPLGATAAFAEPSPPSGGSGGATFQPPPPPPEKATLVDGRVIAPASAPQRVKDVIDAANRIVRKPYIYGGGHKVYKVSAASALVKLDRGYDCSGSVSFALHGGGFLRSPLPSGPLMSWAQKGPGTWITVYSSPSHAYLVVAGLRFDTSMHDQDAPGPRTGPRWSRTLRKSKAFVARHPRGY